MNIMDKFSIGVDIVSIERISKKIKDKNNRFVDRVYTNFEKKYCKNKENISYHFAGRLAAKEAVSKALKIPWDERGINWKDIEIINDKNNIPDVILYGDVKLIADEKKIKDIKISISHEKEYAVAFAIAFEGMKNE
jgi:holo-[acyl-carrier protein] synthase